MLFWALAEPLRLLAGWAGNLGENVPWLVIYCVLCLVPQSAVAYYLMLAAYVRVVVHVLCTKAAANGAYTRSALKRRQEPMR